MADIQIPTNYTTATIRPYLAYTALVTQTGTDVPVSEVLENTIQASDTWQRTSPGSYKLPTTYPYTSKIFVSGFPDGSGNGYAWVPISDAGSVQGYWFIYWYDDSGFISFGINSKDAQGAAVELSTLLGGSVLSFPEIRVYP
jgi:hypothetical protein